MWFVGLDWGGMMILSCRLRGGEGALQGLWATGGDLGERK
jgi:hypothetical protein